MKLKVLIATVAILMFNNAYAESASTLQNAIKGEIYTAQSQPELYCLAMNIYHESKSEPLAGQYAVADVTINRTLDTRYPNTVCEVVMQARMKESWKTKQYPDLPDSERKYVPVRNKCQFSWYCDGKADAVRDSDAWRKAQEVAYRIVVEKKYRGITEGSTHYHADYVSPRWASSFDLVGRVGAHIFYRWAR
jgi:N-acetylmuramoyl-L-alanine amidase